MQCTQGISRLRGREPPVSSPNLWITVVSTAVMYLTSLAACDWAVAPSPAAVAHPAMIQVHGTVLYGSSCRGSLTGASFLVDPSLGIAATNLAPSGSATTATPTAHKAIDAMFEHRLRVTLRDGDKVPDPDHPRPGNQRATEARSDNRGKVDEQAPLRSGQALFFPTPNATAALIDHTTWRE